MFLIPCKATGLGIYLAFHSVEREPQRIQQHAVFRFRQEPVPLIVPCLGSGAPPTRLPNFPLLPGSVFVFLPPLKMKGRWEGRGSG